MDELQSESRPNGASQQGLLRSPESGLNDFFSQKNGKIVDIGLKGTSEDLF